MSKLSKLRGGSAPVKIFSENIDTSSASVFDRMLSNKPANAKVFPQKKKYVPSRFRCAKGETKRIVLLDVKFTFGMREHSLQGADGKWTTERCISEWDTCPICSTSASVYDIALLTVLDLTPWTKKNDDGTTTEYAYTKRVLAVKKGDLAAFSGLLNVHGSFRGLVLDMTRGTGDKESAIGKPTYVATLSDEDLIEEFGSEEVLSEQGKVIRPANDAVNAFNYDRYYSAPSRSELSNKYDVPARPGSAEESAPWDEDDSIQTIDLNELPDVD